MHTSPVLVVDGRLVEVHTADVPLQVLDQALGGLDGDGIAAAHAVIAGS